MHGVVGIAWTTGIMPGYFSVLEVDSPPSPPPKALSFNVDVDEPIKQLDRFAVVCVFVLTLYLAFLAVPCLSQLLSLPCLTQSYVPGTYSSDAMITCVGLLLETTPRTPWRSQN